MGALAIATSIVAALLFGGFQLACGSAEPGNPGASLEPPPECALAEVPDDWSYPAGPYGGELGEILEDFSMRDCDGNTVTFGEILSQSRLTLFNIGAGWCEPCVTETQTLDAEIFREFCGRGLRVVQVLFEDEASEIPSTRFCQDWRESFGLSFPVLVDQLFVSEKYFVSVASQTPINFLVDSSGEIVFKSTGTPPADLAERIDALLSQ